MSRRNTRNKGKGNRGQRNTLSQQQKNPQEQEAREQASNNTATLTYHEQTIVSGPLPPPEVLRGYEDLFPGAAGRILEMAERDQEHQQTMQRDALRATRSERRMGQVLGFSLGLTGLAAATYCAMVGATTIGSVLGTTTILGLVGAFVTGRVIRPKAGDQTHTGTESSADKSA